MEKLSNVQEVKMVALIPARGGSKGVVRKNIRQLAGKPLIAYTIETALETQIFDRVIVSTDDQKIAKVAQHHGAEIPFMRPAELAKNDTPDLPVCQHALRWLMMHEKYHPEIVVWAHRTAPLRTVQDVEAVRQLFWKFRTCGRVERN